MSSEGAPEAAVDWRARSRMVGPRRSRWALPLGDVLLAVGCLLLALLGLDLTERFGPHPVYVLNVAAGVLVAAAQAIRRRLVRTSFVITAIALLAYAMLTLLSPVNLGLSPLVLCALTSLHAVARWCGSPRWRWAALICALLGSLANPVTMLLFGRTGGGAFGTVTGVGDARSAALITSALASAVALLAVMVIFMDASSRRRREEDRLRMLAQERGAAAAQERLLISRELHDLLGHSLSAIKVQAATGLAVRGEDVMSRSLIQVRDTAAASLEEVRDLVRVLRGSALDELPPADLGGIRRAAATASGAGLELQVQLPSEEALARANSTWSLLQRLTLLRSVQEGLTNAMRHGSGQAHLEVTLSDGRCDLLLSNSFPSAAVGHRPAAGTGTGLTGLHERVRLAGGSMEAERRTEATGESVFELRISIPVQGAEQRGSEHG